jgi:hypothetical protein
LSFYSAFFNSWHSRSCWTCLSSSFLAMLELRYSSNILNLLQFCFLQFLFHGACTFCYYFSNYEQLSLNTSLHNFFLLCSLKSSLLSFPFTSLTCKWNLRLFVISLMFLFIYFFIFDHTGVWTQGLMLVRQVLYHLSNSPQLFIFIFKNFCNVENQIQGLECDRKILYHWATHPIPLWLFFRILSQTVGISTLTTCITLALLT